MHRMDWGISCCICKGEYDIETKEKGKSLCKRRDVLNGNKSKVGNRMKDEYYEK